MQLKSLLAVAFLATSAAAVRTCGTADPTEINVYWHVVSTSQSTAGGYIAQATLDEQLAVLNAAYAPHDISFVSAGADWTTNSVWAADRSIPAMKAALRKGTYADLNVYFIPGTQYLGYATFPTTVTPGSTTFNNDGVVVLSSSVPGGSLADYNLGHTATHEVGHWLGLFHTFQGGCTGEGDFVDDTPAEATWSYGCQVGRDTCPNQPGLDSVTNYMNYSDDDCFDHFTSGQEARVYSQWDAFRASHQ
ncbi:metalloprotease [Colletotrichum plurivorum]|uniref:Metalloprotease n=1 Tax=Colletotrichum plurivorum TaxID=2175906 RepID=A0A8H6KPV8_9PEZI|nr:metalloprotease [Colletotrichum plurivorum]